MDLLQFIQPTFSSEEPRRTSIKRINFLFFERIMNNFRKQTSLPSAVQVMINLLVSFFKWIFSLHCICQTYVMHVRWLHIDPRDHFQFMNAKNKRKFIKQCQITLLYWAKQYTNMHPSILSK